jgi:hypothetical protein
MTMWRQFLPVDELASRPPRRGRGHAPRRGCRADDRAWTVLAANGIATADRLHGVVGASAETCGGPTCRSGARAAAIPFTASGLGDASRVDARQTRRGACPHPRTHAEACRSRGDRSIGDRARVLSTSADCVRRSPGPRPRAGCSPKREPFESVDHAATHRFIRVEGSSLCSSSSKRVERLLVDAGRATLDAVYSSEGVRRDARRPRSRQASACMRERGHGPRPV